MNRCDDLAEAFRSSMREFNEVTFKQRVTAFQHANHLRVSLYW